MTATPMPVVPAMPTAAVRVKSPPVVTVTIVPKQNSATTDLEMLAEPVTRPVPQRARAPRAVMAKRALN
jgi:hypothetical protein